MIKFVCDFRQVDGFLRVLRFLPLNKSDRHVFTEILYKEALNYITLKHQSWQYCLGPLFFLLPKISLAFQYFTMIVSDEGFCSQKHVNIYYTYKYE